METVTIAVLPSDAAAPTHVNTLRLNRKKLRRSLERLGPAATLRACNEASWAGYARQRVSWKQQGIAHQRVRPSSPQENGAHERMHRTRKRQAIKPVRQTCTARQRNFDAFRREYNEERPHEALGQTTPASPYTVSLRPYLARLPQPEYPWHFLLKRITTAGIFKSGNRLLYIANARTNQQIGFKETDDGLWAISFHTVLMATFDERDCVIQS